MARPQKGTIDYFPHYIKEGKTIRILEEDFGNDGYAFWFKLLEVLGSTNGMYFDWNKMPDRRFLLARTKVEEETALNIIQTLVDVEAIDRELWEKHQVIWVQNLIDNVRDAFKRRSHALPKRPVFDGTEQLELPIGEDGLNLSESPRKPEAEPYEEKFVEFWEAYPRKIAKRDAESAFKSLMKNKTSFDEIMQATKNYARECNGKEMQFIKHPATFLRKERWKDYLKPEVHRRQTSDPAIKSRHKEIEFQQWLEEGKDPDEFDWS